MATGRALAPIVGRGVTVLALVGAGRTAAVPAAAATPWTATAATAPGGTGLRLGVGLKLGVLGEQLVDHDLQRVNRIRSLEICKPGMQLVDRAL